MPQRRFCVGMTTALLTLTGAAFGAIGADAPVDQVLFVGQQGGYALYRIPGIVVTPKGTVLAYCEARRTGKSDWDTIDILLRRGLNGGQTWGPPRVMAAVPGPKAKNPTALQRKMTNPDDVTYDNPVAIASRDGTVHFLFCLEYMRCFYRRSDDDGETFSGPVEISSAFEELRAHYPWKVLATGPGHGIELKSGRLVVPVWLSRQSDQPGGDHRPSCVTTIYSDDHGHSWHAGAIVIDHPDLKNPSESAVVELADGRVLINIRSEGVEHRRAVAISPDGAHDWTKPVFDPALLEPICMASLVRFPARSPADHERILFSNPANLGPAPGARPGAWPVRRNLTIRVGEDDGKTWPVQKVLEPGIAGYSDLAVAPDGSIFCFFERDGLSGNSFQTRGLCLSRFTLDWLTNRDARGAASP